MWRAETDKARFPKRKPGATRISSCTTSLWAVFCILIRNRPLDNGLIDYAGFIASFAAACGISDRIHFIEGGKAHQMMSKSLGMVVLNSTIP